MRRKKVFIAIVILLVLGLGVVAEYQRRTRDIEFEIPSMSMPRYCTSPRWESTIAVSDHYVVYEDMKSGLTAFDVLKNTRIKVCDKVKEPITAICEPWIVWSDANSISGYDLRNFRSFQICAGQYIFPIRTCVVGNNVIWFDNGDIVGYDLEKEVKFPIYTRPKTLGLGSIIYMGGMELDFNGNLVVWSDINFKNKLRSIIGYDLQSQKRFIIRTTPSYVTDPKVSGRYVVWKESEQGNSNVIRSYRIMAFDIEKEEIKTICTEVTGSYDIDICDDVIVWESKSSNEVFTDVFGYNLRTGHIFPICTEKNNQYAPKISGNIVIWCDHQLQEGWLSRLLKKEPCQIRGKIFRHWPGEGKGE
jgi:hypothetical protein